MAEAILEASKARPDSGITKIKSEDVVYRMFEINMDEYLDEEIESVKIALEGVCKRWDQQVGLVYLHILSSTNSCSACLTRRCTFPHFAESGSSETERSSVLH
jgi:hypothetical protein